MENFPRKFHHLHEFEYVFHKQDGILHLAKLHPREVRETYRTALCIVRSAMREFWREYTLTPRYLPGICYTGGSAPNAYAKLGDGRAYIGVAAGLADNLMWWSHTLLSHPSIFTDLGYPEREAVNRCPPRSKRNIQDPPPSPRVRDVAQTDSVDKLYKEERYRGSIDYDGWDNLNEILADPDPPSGMAYESVDLSKEIQTQVRSLNHLHYVHFGWQKPLCFLRAEFASYVACAGICQAFIHELAHYFCGHLDSKLKLPRILREYDADAMAMQTVLAFRIVERLTAKFSWVAAQVKDGTQQPDLPYYLWAQGVVLLNYMNLPAISHQKQEVGHGYSHPGERAWLQFRFIDTIQKKHPKTDAMNHMQALGTAMRTLQDVWRNSKIPGHELMPHSMEGNAALYTSALDHLNSTHQTHSAVMLALNNEPSQTRRLLGINVIKTLSTHGNS